MLQCGMRLQQTASRNVLTRGVQFSVSEASKKVDTVAADSQSVSTVSQQESETKSDTSDVPQAEGKLINE